MKIINASKIDGMPTLDSAIEVEGVTSKVCELSHDANAGEVWAKCQNGVEVKITIPRSFYDSK